MLDQSSTNTARIYATGNARIWHRSSPDAQNTEAARTTRVLCGTLAPFGGLRWTHAGVIFDSEVASGTFRVCRRCQAVAS